jgi:hypothetical protein
MAFDHATVFKTPTAGDAALSEVVRRLVEAYRPERIYLFGSVARGDAGPDSDYDIMVVVPDNAPPELRRGRAAYVALWGTGVASDVLVWTASQFDGRLHLAASLPALVAEVRAWLSKAGKDLAAARYELQADPPFAGRRR